MQFPVLALEQHLGDSGYASEVAVNLERRMGIKQVGKGGLAEKFPVHLIGMVAVQKS